MDVPAPTSAAQRLRGDQDRSLALLAGGERGVERAREVVDVQPDLDARAGCRGAVGLEGTRRHAQTGRVRRRADLERPEVRVATRERTLAGNVERGDRAPPP